MPLLKGKPAKTKSGMSRNISTEIRSGKPKSQAIAIAFRIADKSKPSGKSGGKPPGGKPPGGKSSGSKKRSASDTASASAAAGPSPANPLAAILRKRR